MTKRIPRARMRAWRLFLTAHARITAALECELDEAGEVPLTWYDVLVQLSEAGGRLRMQDLARSVLLSKSGLTRLVDRMASDGLVAREPCASDRRGMLAVVTPAGIAALRRASPVHQAGIERHFVRYLSDDEARAMRSAFEKMLAALEAPSPA